MKTANNPTHPCSAFNSKATSQPPRLPGRAIWPAQGAVGLSLMVLLGTAPTEVRAQAAEKKDTVAFEAGVRHSWDSNYNRRPEASEEQITVANAGVEVNHDISRQQFSGRFGAARYLHKQRDSLDTTAYRGGLSWRGEWGNALRSNLSWSRTDRLVDRAEFTGKDVITFDERQATLVYLISPRWEAPFTLRQASQEHSNESQEGLDFKDREVITGIRYKSGRNSTVTTRLVGGEREYTNQEQGLPGGIQPGEDLDFDYTLLELETNWAVTDKTRMIGTVGYFNRQGEANDGSGGQAGIEGQWQASSKVRLISGYQFTQPPVGETSDNPSETQRVYLEAEWQLTPKISLGSSLAHVSQDFDRFLAREARNETTNRISPLTVNYRMSDTLDLRLASAWQERDSPIDERNYSTEEITLGLELRL